MKQIFHTLKSRGFGTVVMGASFRQLWQIEALAGCDKLTIAPNLLDMLANDHDTLPRALDSRDIDSVDDVAPLREQQFRWLLNDDPMASELLADGIRCFARDQEALEALLGAVR